MQPHFKNNCAEAKISYCRVLIKPVYERARIQANYNLIDPPKPSFLSKSSFFASQAHDICGLESVIFNDLLSTAFLIQINKYRHPPLDG